MAIRQRKVKYPENRKIKDKLKYGDGKELATRTGLTDIYVNEMLTGNKRMTDKLKRAIIELLNERQALDQALNEIVNQ